MVYKISQYNDCKIAIIGIGYVGLPLAIEFSKTKLNKNNNQKINHEVIGFDINHVRVKELNDGFDRTNETNPKDLLAKNCLKFTNVVEELDDADVFIITVPTPIDENKLPDLKPLKNACKIVGNSLLRKKQNVVNENFYSPIVIFESTVFPGATEEICVPLIEEYSGLKYNSSSTNLTFFCGYSPERINPGDKTKRLKDIVKITSGSNQIIADWVDNFYNLIIEAGTYKAKSISVAEAAKVIENTQRDLNIALVNELSIIFKKINLDTNDVLDAACSKWNFQDFRPGLVGGHCIGVDPYYLTYKSNQLGYNPKVVLAGRRINDNMSNWIVDEVINELGNKAIKISEASFLILGLSFKENCPDIRNTKIIEIARILKKYSNEIDIVDPWVYKEDAKKTYGIDISSEISLDKKYNVIILAVPHHQFVELERDNWSNLLTDKGFIFDIKGALPRDINAIRL